MPSRQTNYHQPSLFRPQPGQLYLVVLKKVLGNKVREKLEPAHVRRTLIGFYSSEKYYISHICNLKFSNRHILKSKRHRWNYLNNICYLTNILRILTREHAISIKINEMCVISFIILFFSPKSGVYLTLLAQLRCRVFI